MKTVIQSLISHVDNDNTGDIEINFLADKKLEAEWTEIKKCEPGKVHVRTSGMPCSPTQNKVRTKMQVIWPVEFIRTEFGELNVSLNKQKYLQRYPFLKDANQKFYTKIVNSQEKKKRKSRAEQRKIYKELLDSGKVKNQAEIARKFGVSRAWVSKVLS